MLKFEIDTAGKGVREWYNSHIIDFKRKGLQSQSVIFIGQNGHSLVLISFPSCSRRVELNRQRHYNCCLDIGSIQTHKCCRYLKRCGRIDSHRHIVADTQNEAIFDHFICKISGIADNSG